jgi:hypothetical protein
MGIDKDVEVEIQRKTYKTIEHTGSDLPLYQ